MNQTKHGYRRSVDHSGKSILARGCDPYASAEASNAIPPMIGNPEYVPTTTDEEFVEQLQSRDWSVVFFAPGACRYSAASQQIPGGNSRTRGWSMEQYRELVLKHQGEGIRIVETTQESETVRLLTEALGTARDTR